MWIQIHIGLKIEQNMSFGLNNQNLEQNLEQILILNKVLLWGKDGFDDWVCLDCTWASCTYSFLHLVVTIYTHLR